MAGERPKLFAVLWDAECFKRVGQIVNDAGAVVDLMHALALTLGRDPQHGLSPEKNGSEGVWVEKTRKLRRDMPALAVYYRIYEASVHIVAVEELPEQ